MTNANAFSASSGNMDFKRELDFKIGNAIFRKNWVSAPASTDASDGLGPLFNSRACQNCHLKDGRGHPPFTEGIPDDSHSMLMRLSVPAKTEEEKAKLASHELNVIPEPTYGGQLQDLSIQGHKAEGQIKIDYKEVPVKLAGGETVHLRAPTYSIADPGYGPLASDVMMSPRVAPPMIGLGLLEAIPEQQILANVDTGDANKDGISCKPNWVWSKEENKVVLGRFGWKAGVPTINQQTAEAASGDIGLSTSMIRTPSGDCTDKQQDCLNAPNGNSPKYQDAELGDDLFKLIAFYSHNLAVPPRRDPEQPESAQGQGAVLCDRLRHLPQAEIRDRRCARPTASVASVDLALHGPLAARHGRGARRQSPRGRSLGDGVAHVAAMGHRPHRDRQRSYVVSA